MEGKKLWAFAVDCFCNQGSPFNPTLETRSVQEWIDSYEDPRKRNLAQKCYDDFLEGRGRSASLEDSAEYVIEYVLKKGLTIFLKGNEVLFDKLLFGCVKPRTVIAVPIFVQLYLQQYAMAATVSLKKYLNSRLFEIGSVKAHFKYAAGATDGASLTEWYYDTLKRRSAGVDSYIMMGDDMLGYSCSREFWIVLDYSNYDSTQGETAIKAEMAGWKKMGLPQDCIDVTEACHRAKATKRGKNKSEPFYLKFEHPEMIRITGGWNTSAGGTMVNIMAVIAAISENWRDDVWTDLGLVAKISFHPTIDTCDFLKGRWWMLANGRRSWLWLTSSILKQTKICRPIRKGETIENCMWGMAKGMGVMPSNFPLLAAMQKFMLKMGSLSSKYGLDGYVEHYRGKNDESTLLDEGRMRDHLAHRYGIDYSNILALEEVINGLISYPVVISSPIFVSLADKDY
jgi:hypothetical protein